MSGRCLGQALHFQGSSSVRPLGVGLGSRQVSIFRSYSTLEKKLVLYLASRSPTTSSYFQPSTSLFSDPHWAISNPKQASNTTTESVNIITTTTMSTITPSHFSYRIQHRLPLQDGTLQSIPQTMVLSYTMEITYATITFLCSLMTHRILWSWM